MFEKGALFDLSATRQMKKGNEADSLFRSLSNLYRFQKNLPLWIKVPKVPNVGRKYRLQLCAIIRQDALFPVLIKAVSLTSLNLIARKS
jgi:hypothetical protein